MFDYTMINNINRIISNGSLSRLTQKEFLELEISKWKSSTKRKNMIVGKNYYVGQQDILTRQRTAIGEDGELYEVSNLPNNKIIDNQYAKMVDQKKNYLLGKPITLDTENEIYKDKVSIVLNKSFQRTLKNVGADSLNCGIGWIYPYYNEKGEFKLKRFEPYEILPFWRDAEHTDLEFTIRVYEQETYDGTRTKIIEKVEIYTKDGIERYILNNSKLVPDIENPSNPYIITTNSDGEQANFNWEKVPLIAFKYNQDEIPLITRVKSLQDGINTILSDFENNTQEDARNTILILENYDGTNLGEFRRNLATYGAVKVSSMDGSRGSVSTLKIEVSVDTYRSILEVFKKALIENARGYDAKDDKMSGTPNQMNIQSMYNDIDLDANDMETEFQASLEELMWFVNMHLTNTGNGNFANEELDIIFNRDMIMNKTEAMDMLIKAGVQISNETLLGQVPFISDVDKEVNRLKDQKEQETNDYMNAFAIPEVGDVDVKE